MVVEPTQDPFESDEESVEEGGKSSLWRRVVQQYPSLADVSFSQFASLDEDFTTENQRGGGGGGGMGTAGFD